MRGINLVEIDRAPKLGSFGPDIADFDGCVVGQLSLDLQVPILAIGRYTVVGADRLRSVCGWNNKW